MEYIKKEELIKGEIYKASNESLTFIMKATKNLYDVINIPSYNEFMKSGNFNGSYLTFINATSEEKHWLNECVKLDKFITFEEAMKTFIPEYVEWIDNIGSGNLGYQTKDHFKKNKIFKTDVELPSHGFQTQNWIKHLEIYANNYKRSTKEAYNAQFVVKEPEFVLPEKWCVKTTLSNKNILQDYLQNNIINYPEYLKTWEVINDRYFHNKGHGYGEGHSSYRIFDGFIEITFEQFKKYVLKEEIVEEKVIEPLPQFKVIESVETITKVENNEGNQFFIGDVVISSNGTIQTIESFDYNKAKTNIIAFTNKQSRLGNGIGIDKIEHYIEPKVEVEETLLEKAKRLYPIGTKFKAARGSNGEYKVQSNSEFRENSDGAICIQNNGNGTIYFNNEWAEIIK